MPLIDPGVVAGAVASGGPIALPVYLAVGDDGERWEIGRVSVAIVVATVLDPDDPTRLLCRLEPVSDEPLAEQIAVMLNAAAATLRE